MFNVFCFSDQLRKRPDTCQHGFPLFSQPLDTWTDRIASERVAVPQEREEGEIAPIYSDFTPDTDTDPQARSDRPVPGLPGLEGHVRGHDIAHHQLMASKLAGMSRKERAAESLKLLQSMDRVASDRAGSQLKDLLAPRRKNSVGLTETHRDSNPLSRHHNLKPQTSKYVVKAYLSLPLPRYSLPAATVLQSQWVKELQLYLSSHKDREPISIVTATIEHEAVLLNWLISANLIADPPLKNVLVLAISAEIDELLQSKDIPVIYVSPSTILNTHGKREIRTAFSRVHVVRLTLFRLLSHWGVDAVMYDADAIVLKNPQPLLDAYPKIDIVGSAGRGPAPLLPAWGRTLCTGFMLMRGGIKMGMLFSIHFVQ